MKNNISKTNIFNSEQAKYARIANALKKLCFHVFGTKDLVSNLVSFSTSKMN